MQDIATLFAEMALNLHAQADSQSTVQHIAEYAKSATACDDVGVFLNHGRGRIETAAATSERVGQADLLQMECGEGPCLAAIELNEDIVVRDTADDERWPAWGPKVADLGLRSVISVRLATLDRTYGALNLYGARAESFDQDDIAVAHIFARHASVAWAAAHNEQGLQQAIDARKLIGQAQGILMERFGIDDENAFRVLRRYSQDSNVKLRVVAEQVIATRKLPDLIP